MNYAKILVACTIFFFSQPSLGMISPTNKTASETELFFPDTLIAKSKYLKNIQTDTNPPIIEEENKKYLVLDKQFFPTEGTSQQLINELSDLYENTQISSLSKNTQQDHNQLIILANLDHTLVETSNPAKKLLETLLADTIISCPIEQLSVFDTLNSDLTKKITLKIIKNNKLDTQLLKPYQKTFPKKTIKLLDPQNKNHDAHLLFFNDEQMIYGIINENIKPIRSSQYKQIVITDRNIQTIKTIPLAKALPEALKRIKEEIIFVSPNGAYCLLQTYTQTMLKNDPIPGTLYLDYTYKLINNTTGDIEDLPHLTNQVWCFTSDNILCSTNKITATPTITDEITTTPIITINVLNLSQKHAITTAEIPSPNNNLIDQIQCHIKYDNDHMKVMALISYANGTAFICDNHTTHQIEYPFQDDPICLMYLQNSGNKGFIITQNVKLLTIDLITKKINSNQTNLYEYQANNPQTIKATNNDTFLTTVFNHTVKDLKTYAFIMQNTLNTWNKKALSDYTTVIISKMGDIAIEIPDKSIFSLFPTPQCINLYDNNMLESSSYWNTNRTDDIPAHTKLLVASLLYKIFKKAKSNLFTSVIQLDETESRVYNQDCPQAIQAILKTLFTIQLSYQPQTPESVSANTSQHSYFSSFTNYTNSMYKTLTDTISQYKTQLILGTAVIGSAIGLTALYKYLMDKQSLPQQ